MFTFATFVVYLQENETVRNNLKSKHMRITNLMKTAVVATIAMLAANFDMEAKNIKLPAPERAGGMPMNEVVANRHSVRVFDPAREVETAKLGQALWLSVGVNRPDAKPEKNGHAANRSNPTAMNWQEIEAYVFGKAGVWKYEPATHALTQVCEGDHRSLIAGTAEFCQDFVLDAPYSVVFVANMEGLPEGDRTSMMAMVDAGIACENFNLAAVSLGLATVPRATMDSAAIARLLGLTEAQVPVINNPVGYAK